MKKNIIFVLIVLALAGACWIAIAMGRQVGGRALVSIVDAKTQTVSLEQDGTYTFGATHGAKLPVTLEVLQGRVRFVNSQCPDHVCEGFGWLQYTHDQALCLPAGVVVNVEVAAN